MRLALDTRSAIVRRLRLLRVDQIKQWGGRKFAPKRQEFLLELLMASYQRSRRHAAQADACSFSRDFLVKGLRADPSDYKKLLRPFFEFPEDNCGYDAGRGITKPYSLRPEVLAALDAVFAGDESLPAILYDDSGAIVPIAQLPSNGVPATVANRLSVPSIIPLSTAQVGNAIDILTRQRDARGGAVPLDPAKPNGTNLDDAIRILRLAKSWVRSVGGLPNLYNLQSNGRLGPEGFNIINLPSSLRRLLFDGAALVDYDLFACHWIVFLSLAQALGERTPMVDDYIGDRCQANGNRERSVWYKRWRWITSRSLDDDFKAIALSLLTGGMLSPSTRTEGARRIGSGAMRLLCVDPPTRELKAEIDRVMDRITLEVPKREIDGNESVVTNAVGACLALHGEPGDRRRLRSHVLTGFEQFAIREMCRRAAGVQAIVYDGFIAPPQDVNALRRGVFTTSEERLGVRLHTRLKGKELTAPDRWKSFRRPDTRALGFVMPLEAAA